jgi:poly-gamma-glutamate synthesis protein (capsule biosynthesis protein)
MDTLLIFLLTFFHLTSPLVTVGFVGDLGLGRNITSTARAKNNFNWSFVGVEPWLLSNDFNVANLESPIIAKCPDGKTGTFTFCGDSRFIPNLKSNRFILNLNNNHILNYGSSGLSETQAQLPESFYSNFYTKTIKNISFGFLGFDFITYPKTDIHEIINKIKSVDSSVDYLIVSIHWGNEYLPVAEKWRLDLAHQMIDAGADVIHGHHPHVWQGSEVYKGKPIFYSFGNFIFDQSWSYETSHSQIARLTFAKDKITNTELFPIEIRSNSQPWLKP